MAASSDGAPVARSSDRAPRRASTHLPGHGSMWFFVIGELWIFTAYFACYVHDRALHADQFLAGQQLLQRGVGVLNTVILLTSSLFVALCVQATRDSDIPAARRFLTLGGGCGVLFVLVKAAEWYVKLRHGLPAQLHEFFLYYFMFTGLHLVHVGLGLLILGLMWRELRSARRARPDFVEAGATYWHMVDALWIAIFALVYLMR